MCRLSMVSNLNMNDLSHCEIDIIVKDYDCCNALLCQTLWFFEDISIILMSYLFFV